MSENSERTAKDWTIIKTAYVRLERLPANVLGEMKNGAIANEKRAKETATMRRKTIAGANTELDRAGPSIRSKNDLTPNAVSK